MKAQWMSLLLVTVLFTVGCAEEKKKKNDNAATTAEEVPYVEIPDGPFVPPGSGPGQGPGDAWQYGGSTDLEVTSLSRFMEYTGRVMNSPQNVQINLNLLKYGNGYGGVVSITYTDNGIPYEGYFTSGNTAEEVQYNIWFVKDSKFVWHGFFSDYLGGLIVVIDEVVDLGDGSPVDSVSGSVWFKNFGLTYAPHPPTRCWFVSLGPYDCRAWPSGNGVNTTQAVEPNNGYVKLGTFSNLSLRDAFNDEVDL